MVTKIALRTLVAAFAVTLIGLPQKALALELSYPDFFPLDQVSSLGGLVRTIFTASIAISGIIAFATLVYVGFQYLVSGESPKKRFEAKRRLIAVLMGALILLFSVLLLRFINPDLAVIPSFSLPSFTAKEQPLPKIPKPGFVNAQDYTSAPLEDTVQSSLAFLDTLGNDLPPLLDDVTSLSGQCSANLCTPGASASYQESVIFDCSYPDENGDIVIEFCQACQWATCREGPCTGDPLPQRSNLEDLVVVARATLQDVSRLGSTLSARKRLAASCPSAGSDTGLTSCATAQALSLSGSSQCSNGQDFFCVSPGSTFAIHLPLIQIADVEEKLSQQLSEISQISQSGSCSNTTFTCPNTGGICSQGTGSCIEKPPAKNGCPAQLEERAQRLAILAQALSSQAQKIRDAVESADNLGSAAATLDGELSLSTCQEARKLAENIVSDETLYQDESCIEGTACCPSLKSVADVHACQDIDLFACS